MALNNPDAGSTTRQPRGIVKANGVTLKQWRSLEVVNNSHLVSDTWSVALPLYAQPADMGPTWWSTQTDVEVEIAVAFLGSDGNLGSPKNLIIGLVDEVEQDPFNGLLTIRGRDYSSAFIQSSTTDIYLNDTASEVAKKLAAEHGLPANVTATTAPIARYYGDSDDGTRLTRHESEWDFLTALAEQEGFQVLMQGKTLYFGPKPTPDTANPYVLKVVPASAGAGLISNMKRIKLTRSLTIARDVDVWVLSADRNSGGVVKGHFTATNKLRANRSGQKVPAQVYTFNIPNLTQGQAQQKAEALAQQITQHERLIEGSIPGDPALTPQVVIKLTGTGTDFDQLYYPDRLTHELSVEGGYSMDIRAKNHSTYSSVPL